MKSIEIKLLKYNSHLFDYPIENLNSNYFIGKQVWILNDNPDFNPYIEKIQNKGAKIKHLNSIEDISNEDTPEIAIVFPQKGSNETNTDCKEQYYKVFYHYIKFAQIMVHKMSNHPHIFSHLVFIFPPGANCYSCKLQDMAYYALTGLTAGLGKIYASKAVFINGLILNEKTNEDCLMSWIEYLISNNSNNLIGQNIKL